MLFTTKNYVFCADTSIFKKKIKKIKKMSSKVANNRLVQADFSTTNRLKTRQNIKFCSVQMAQRATYISIMTERKLPRYFFNLLQLTRYQSSWQSQ